MTYTAKNQKNLQKEKTPKTISVTFCEYISKILVDHIASNGLNPLNQEELYNLYLYTNKLLNEALGDFGMIQKQTKVDSNIWKQGFSKK